MCSGLCYRQSSGSSGKAESIGIDSLVFFPIAFWGIGPEEMLKLMVTQIIVKTAYEIMILPVTNIVVHRLKSIENLDTFDRNISYNPVRIKDL